MEKQQEARGVDLADELVEAKAGTYNNLLSL
jgi:hypothetical protein